MDETSVIYRGYYLGLEVGIKEYNLQKLSETDKKHFLSEVNLLVNLRHPNIIFFIGITMERNSFSIITEYMKQKSLKNVLDNKKIPLSDSQLINFCLDSALALWYMHSRNPPVLHRDIKSSNCLLDEFYRLKLCDLGLSKVFDKNFKKTDTKANTYWMSPEALLTNTFTEKSDIYSLGILFWEIMHRDTTPYKDSNETCFYFEENLRTIRPKIDNNINQRMIKLIKACWEFESINRPNIEEVVSILMSIKEDEKFKEDNNADNTGNIDYLKKPPKETGKEKDKGWKKQIHAREKSINKDPKEKQRNKSKGEILNSSQNDNISLNHIDSSYRQTEGQNTENTKEYLSIQSEGYFDLK